MRIDGVWFLCDDDTVRPIVRADALTAAGRWQPLDFLVDTGADSTVFCADVREALALPPQQRFFPGHRLPNPDASDYNTQGKRLATQRPAVAKKCPRTVFPALGTGRFRHRHPVCFPEDG